MNERGRAIRCRQGRDLSIPRGPLDPGMPSQTQPHRQRVHHANMPPMNGTSDSPKMTMHTYVRIPESGGSVTVRTTAATTKPKTPETTRASDLRTNLRHAFLVATSHHAASRLIESPRDSCGGAGAEYTKPLKSGSHLRRLAGSAHGPVTAAAQPKAGSSPIVHGSIERAEAVRRLGFRA